MPFTKCMVATGGGAVIRRKNWGYMQHGVVIWLDGSPELLATHVAGQDGGTTSRPLIVSNPDPSEEVGMHLMERACNSCNEKRAYNSCNRGCSSCNKHATHATRMQPMQQHSATCDIVMIYWPVTYMSKQEVPPSGLSSSAT